MKRQGVGAHWLCSICLALLVLVVGCASPGLSRIGSLRGRTIPGMVYNERHQPVAGAVLHLEGSVVAVTGADGRFLLPHRGSPATVEIRAPGVWPVSFRLGRSAPDSVLYVRMMSMDPDLDRALSLLLAGELAGAERILDSMLRAQEDWPPLLAARLRLHLERGETGAALDTLLRLSVLAPGSSELARLREATAIP